MPPVSAYFLTDGGQDADSVALRLCDFLAAAKRSLEIAIYDLRLEGSAQQRLVDAVRAATSRGVDVRLIFNVDHQKAVPIPPPPKIDFDLIHALGVHFRPISGVPDLMHHKYVVRDRASVLTGSTNWTTDSWTREENVLVEVESPELAAMYLANFEELWTTRDVSASGKGGTSWVEPPGLADGRIRPFFTPGGAHRLVHEIAHCIATTTRRLRICSPVITSGPILGTLGEVVLRPGLDLKGVYDATQMHSVIAQWGGGVSSGWKVAAFESVVNSGQFASKRSIPYAPGSIHDFMHAKITVVDNTVFVGSYNLSHSGEENAENVLQIEHGPTADLFAAYVDQVFDRYRRPAAGFLVN